MTLTAQVVDWGPVDQAGFRFAAVAPVLVVVPADAEFGDRKRRGEALVNGVDDLRRLTSPSDVGWFVMTTSAKPGSLEPRQRLGDAREHVEILDGAAVGRHPVANDSPVDDAIAIEKHRGSECHRVDSHFVGAVSQAVVWSTCWSSASPSQNSSHEVGVDAVTLGTPRCSSTATASSTAPSFGRRAVPARRVDEFEFLPGVAEALGRLRPRGSRWSSSPTSPTSLGGVKRREVVKAMHGASADPAD